MVYLSYSSILDTFACIVYLLQMVCQLAGDPVMCIPYLECIGLKSRESRHILRQNLQMIMDTTSLGEDSLSPNSQELNKTAADHVHSVYVNSVMNGYSSGNVSENDLIGCTMQNPSLVLDTLQDATTEDEVSHILGAFVSGGLENRKAWLEAGVCQHICNTLQQYLKSPIVQVAGLRAIGKLSNGCELARMELGKVDYLACTLPYLAVASHPSLPEVATAACLAAACLMSDVTPHFNIHIDTMRFQNVTQLLEGRMLEALEIVFELASSLMRVVPDDLFRGNYRTQEQEYSMLDSACLCSLYMSTSMQSVRGVMIKNETIINGLLISLEQAKKRELQQLALLAVGVIVNLSSENENCVALGSKLRVCSMITNILEIMYWHEVWLIMTSDA